MIEHSCDVLIVGGGTGGVAAALVLKDSGLRVILSCSTRWPGGQLTSQAVPPDEHPWIEWTGSTRRYRRFREQVREHYRLHENLNEHKRRSAHLNPGGGWVSRLCFNPAIGAKILEQDLADCPNLQIFRDSRPVSASISGETVNSITLDAGDAHHCIRARMILDATETGELYPLTQTPHRVGAESRSQTGEPHALDGDPEPDNVQGITWCAAVSLESGDFVIEEPEDYDFWRTYEPPNWCGPLLSPTYLQPATNTTKTLPVLGDFSWFSYRQIVDPAIHRDSRSPATILNWPMNDYFLGSTLAQEEIDRQEHYARARQLTLSLIYWLQTENGLRGLRLRGDLTGTEDGLAQEAYIREPRRLEAMKMIREQDVSAELNSGGTLAPLVERSVGIGAYRLDLHPASNGRPTIDMSALPFQIPVGSLLSPNRQNLIAAGKGIGVTHIANGCTRLHPIEWNIGESAALLARHCLEERIDPREIARSSSAFVSFQERLWSEGVMTEWPAFGPL